MQYLGVISKKEKKRKEKNDLSLFLRQALNLKVIQIYAPTIDTEEAEAE